MNEIREIVTKAVIAKGKKCIRLKSVVVPNNDTFSILGCWVINHGFTAALEQDCVVINGNFEINIWYAYDENSKTEVAREVQSYEDKIKTRQIVKNVTSSKDVIVRVLQQPTCTNASITENWIVVDVVLEEAVDVIGETKIAVTAFTNIDPDTLDDSFENEINEDFLKDNIIR